jgi:hypothetical protein
MLAGEPEVNGEGTGEAIVNAYKRVGVGGAIHEKAENYITMFGGGPAYEALHRAVEDVRAGNWSGSLDEIRGVYFYDLFPSLGLLLIVPILMALARSRGRRRPTEWKFSLTLWAVVAIGAIFWGVLMFGDLAARTVMHAGTFAIPVMAFVSCVVGLRAVFPRFAIWWTAIAATLMFAIYVPALRPPPETSYSWLAILVVAGALAGFVFLVLRGEGTAQSTASITSAQDTSSP